MSDQNFIKKLGGRKFFLVLLAYLASAALLIVGKMDFNSFTECAKFVLAVYLAGNVSQDFLTNTMTKNGLSEAVAEAEQSELLGRKFGFIMLVYVITCGMLYFKYISQENYVTLTYWIVGFYISGNVLDKVLAAGVKLPVNK